MDYLELLHRHDDWTHWEYPPGFDYDSVTNRFARFVEQLSGVLDSTPHVETGSPIQDASFHSQISLPVSDDALALIRFSNFGDMVSVYAGSIPESLMRIVQELLLRNGYIYVPATVLSQPYTGSIPYIDTWRARYFDWM